jgi:hypothetical protein
LAYFYDHKFTPVNFFHFFQQVSLVWPDGHVTTLTEDWLKARIFKGKASLERKAMAKRGKLTLYAQAN